MKHIFDRREKGDTIILLIILIGLMTLIELPLFDFLSTELRAARSQTDSEQALQVAEAGINYYQWHLAHFPNDFQDGTAAAGPYEHDYVDVDTQETLGHYSLSVTAPLVGSTVVTIQSTGWTAHNPAIKRTITARYGIPSLALYSFLSNDAIWIGDTESVGGQMQSNSGVRFDGTTNAPVRSAKNTYTCFASQGSPCPATKNGVWGSAPPSSQAFWAFPVPAIDFSTLTSDLSTLKSSAQSAGLYLSPSNSNGYSLVFNSAGTVSVYKVTSLQSNPTGWDVNGTAHNERVDYQNRSLQFTQAIPVNGIIYIEDNVWVEGTVKGRVMVAAAKLPFNAATAPTIYIPNNIVYAVKDGTNVLGLLAQNNVVVTNHAPNTLEVDAAMIAQNGSVQFYYYPNDVKTSITVFGSIMTFGQWTWSWVNGSGTIVSGYINTNDMYDSNLLYGPPPGFPLSSNGYQQLSWISN